MMLTANRFDEIKKVVAEHKAGTLERDCENGILDMLAELAAEIDRMKQPAQAQGRGHIKPVVLDSQGKPIVPAPLHHQFAAERRAQYDADRFEAIMALRSPDPITPWKTFSLRWGLSPPPGGWDNHEAILNVVHAVRMVVKAVPYIEKHLSAMYLTGRGIKLPPGVTLTNSVLSGVELPD